MNSDKTEIFKQAREELHEQINGLRARIAEVQRELAPLEEELQKKERLAKSLDEVITPASSGEIGKKGAVASVDRSGVRRHRRGRGVRERVIENVKQVLRDAGGGPLHIEEIRNSMLQEGMDIPGQGKAANLIAHLSEAVEQSELERPRRGVYKLPSRGRSGGSGSSVNE